MLLLCLTWRFLLQVRSTGGEWRTVEVPSSVKAIVVLNLQSYAGGRDLWGLKDTAKDAQKGWRTPIFNDGTIEVGVMLTHCCKRTSTDCLPAGNGLRSQHTTTDCPAQR